MSSFRVFRRLFAACFLGALCVAPLQAAVHCVATTTELAAAWYTAKQSAGADEIRIRTGIYGPPPANVSHDAQYDALLASGNHLTLSGGWTDAACSAQTADAGLTLIDGANQKRIIDIGVSGGSLGTTITIANLMLWRGNAGGELGGCLRVQGYQDIGANVYLDRVIMSECLAGQRGGALAAMVQNGRIEVRGSLFVFNEADIDSAIYLYDDVGNIYFNNNSVIGNTTRLAQFQAMKIVCTIPNQCQVANNVFWNNQDASGQSIDLSVVGSVSLLHNRLDSYSGVPVGNTGNTNAHPGFTQFNDFYVHADSPLRNAGRNDIAEAFPDRDIKGVPRPGGGVIDIGAFEFNEPEAALFAAGFE